jgi:hypothetical protein
MSKCKVVQDEKKIHQIVVRRKEGVDVLQQRVVKAVGQAEAEADRDASSNGQKPPAAAR